MKKYLLAFIFIFSSLNASEQNHPYFINDMHGFIQKEKFSFNINKLLMNDSVDLLKLKQQELDTSSVNDAIGSIGDLSGYETKFRYRMYDDAMFSLTYQKSNLDYGLGSLVNQKIDFFLRHNLVSKNFAIDVGIKTNKADDISSDRITNSALNQVDFPATVITNPNHPHPFLPTKPYLIVDKDGNTFKDNNGNDIVLQTDHNTINSFLKNEYIDDVGIKNMKDTTYYLRATRSFVEDGIYSKDFYVGFEYTKVDSELDIQITQNKDLTSIIEDELSKRDLDLSRKEKKFLFGVNHSWFVNKWYMDIGYEFNYILRDKELNQYKINHKLSAYLGYEIVKNTVLFAGAKIMSNQYVGEIPYLYNDFTQSSFNKKYGYAKIGFMYSF